MSEVEWKFSKIESFGFFEVVGCVVGGIFESNASKRFSSVVQIMKFMKFRSKNCFFGVLSFLSGDDSVVSYAWGGPVARILNCRSRVESEIWTWQRRALRVFRAETRLTVYRALQVIWDFRSVIWA